MVDYVTDIKKHPFILADRAISTLQLQVIGNLKDHIRLGLTGANVKSDGSLILNLAPSQAEAIAKELMNLSRKGRLRVG